MASLQGSVFNFTSVICTEKTKPPAAGLWIEFDLQLRQHLGELDVWAVWRL